MPLAQRANKVRGVHLAIVTANKEGDGNPGYRVKVKFPWLNAEEKTDIIEKVGQIDKQRDKTIQVSEAEKNKNSQNNVILVLTKMVRVEGT